jgi:hypothetical protein
MAISLAARIAYGSELKELSDIDVEAWLKAWFEHKGVESGLVLCV